MTWLLGQQEQNTFLQFLDVMDNEMLGVVMILGTIGIFVTTIVTVVTLSGVVTNIKVMKMHQSMVKDLLNQGYSVDDIERLTMSNQGLGKQVKKLVRAATERISNGTRDYRNPVPPVKQSA